MASIAKVIGNKIIEFANDGRKGANNSDGESVCDYDAAINKPSINGVTLQGDKTFGELGLEKENLDIDFSQYFS